MRAAISSAICANVGASATIALVMPVSAWIAGGMLHFRVDQRAPLADVRAIVDAHDADLGDAIVAGGGAGGFEVDEGDRRGEHGRA